MDTADWCNRRDELSDLSNTLSDALTSIGYMKGCNTEDERFFNALRAIGKTIYAEYNKVLDEMIICTAEIEKK